jgi:hypothetical protein
LARRWSSIWRLTRRVEAAVRRIPDWSNRPVRFFIFNDIPVWVRPLARALEACGADVRVSDCPETIRPQDAVVNRISTRVARKQPAQSAQMRAALARWEKESRRVVNGADCLELGFSKWAQAELMRRCGVRTSARCRRAALVHRPEPCLRPAPRGGGRARPGPDRLDCRLFMCSGRSAGVNFTAHSIAFSTCRWTKAVIA